MTSTTFVGFLSRLVATGEFKTLHEHLTTFFDTSYRNSCEENTAFCCELIEIHAKLQGQLFHLLELCSAEGGIYGGSEALKKRLLPWLRNGFLTARINPEDAEVVKEKYEQIVKKMDEDLSASKVEAAELRIKLADAEDEMRALRRQLKENQQGDYQEIIELGKKLTHAKNELVARECQIKELTKETLELKRENSELHGRLHKKILDAATEPEPVRLVTKPYTNGVVPFQSRSAKLVERFTELYKNDRVQTMNSLKGMPDNSTAERLVFLIAEECFTVSKLEQHKMRSRMNQALQSSPQGGLEESGRVNELVENYMKKNTEQYDIETLIPDVIKSLHRNSSIAPYMACNEKLIVPFTREVLRVAWAMVALDPPIDLPAALEGDVINETRYRRTYDSEFSATTIHYFVWPALIRDRKVVAKGEVVTRRISPQKARKAITSTPRPGSAEPFSRPSSYDLGFGSLSSSWSDQSSYKQRFSP
ncbi:hypothetical protein ACROYT_G017884 [Oculina patagonica]